MQSKSQRTIALKNVTRLFGKHIDEGTEEQLWKRSGSVIAMDWQSVEASETAIRKRVRAPKNTHNPP